MRLFDLDAFYKFCEESRRNGHEVWPEYYDDYMESDRFTVKAIPIDKPFLKMRYGDYVVYNKKWLVDHLQTEWTILQGKEYQPSIPIEWIERKLAEHWYVDYDVRELLDDWEKENEID